MPSHMLKTHQNHKFQVLGPCPCDFISLDKSKTIGYFIYSLEKNSEGKFMMKLEFFVYFSSCVTRLKFCKVPKPKKLVISDNSFVAYKVLDYTKNVWMIYLIIVHFGLNFICFLSLDKTTWTGTSEAHM